MLSFVAVRAYAMPAEGADAIATECNRTCVGDGESAKFGALCASFASASAPVFVSAAVSAAVTLGEVPGCLLGG